MSIYDRQYMRYGDYTRRSDPLIWLLCLMLAGYMAQVFCQLVLKNDAATLWMSMSFEGLFNLQVWTLFTYVFAHANPIHIIINLLVIFMVGRVVQDDVGPRRFVWICVYSAIGGAIFFLIFHLNSPGTILLGASAVAMGLMTAYCLARPDEPVTFLIFFVLPLSIKPRKLLIGMAIAEVIMLTAELLGKSGIASSAHLGGMLAAFLYYRKGVQGKTFFPYRKKRNTPIRRSWQAQRYTVNISSRGAMREEVDRILDKINSQGFGSLTDDEKQVLDKAKDVLK
jgi:membrane associated rhomboid family serine protease